MQTASRLNLVTGQIDKFVQGADHRRLLESGPFKADDFRFYIPYIEGIADSGEELEFWPNTNTQSYYRRVVGHGLDHPDKILAQKEARKPFVVGPKKLVVISSEVFGYKGRDHDFGHGLNFAAMPPRSGHYPLNKWILGNRGDFTATKVNSIDGMVKELMDTRDFLRGSGRTMQQSFFVACGGAVVDFRHFLYDVRPYPAYRKETPRGKELEALRKERRTVTEQRARIAQLYTDLHEAKIGLTTRNEFEPGVETPNIVVGMPVLMRLSATEATREHGASFGLICNRSHPRAQTRLQVLLNTEPPSLRESAAFDNVREAMVQGAEYWVLASPRVDFDQARQAVEHRTKGHGRHEMLNMVVTDVAAQLRPVDQSAPRNVAA